MRGTASAHISRMDSLLLESDVLKKCYSRTTSRARGALFIYFLSRKTVSLPYIYHGMALSQCQRENGEVIHINNFFYFQADFLLWEQ